MWTEFQRSSVFDDVVQWRTLSTFLETLTFVSACWWWFCFPEMARPPVPAYEYESVQHLAHLDMILEVLTLVRIAIQIPTTASHTRHATANRYELHRCRLTAYLLACFLQRLVSQDNVVNILDVASIYNFCAANMHSLNLLFITGHEPKITGFSALFLLNFDFLLFWFGLRKANGSTPHLNAPWLHRLLRKIGFREHLVDFRRHSISSPTSLTLHKRFRRRLHPNLHRQVRPEMMGDIQEHYSTLYRLGSSTGASFQTMRELLSAAFPSTQLYYLLRLTSFVNELFRSKAQKLLAQVLNKRTLQVPATLTHLLLPPLHARDWKARLGLWLQ